MTRLKEPITASRGDAGDLCVARVPIFRGLTRAQLETVAQAARPTSVLGGEQVYAPGADASQLVVVHTGQLKVSRVGADGHEQILRILGAGDVIGESELVTGRRPEHFATALGDASMCVFTHRAVDQLIDRFPAIGRGILRAVADRLQETEQRLAALVSEDVTSRLARYLLTLPTQHDGDRLQVELPLARKDIASLLDTTPESVSRQLRRLTDSGVVTSPGGRTLAIHDVDALMALSAS